MYTFKSHLGLMVPNGSGVLAADVLTSTGVHGEHLALHHLAIDRLSLIVTTSVVSTGAVVIQYKKRPTPGSSAGESVIGSLTIPAGTAAGKVLYKEINEVHLDAGQALAIEVTTAAAGGGAAGGCVYGFCIEEAPEVPLNQSNMIASA